MKDEKEMTAQELEQVTGGVHSPKLFSPLLNKESVDPDIDRILQEVERHTQGQSISLVHNDPPCDLQSVDPDIERIWQEAMRHTQGQSTSLGHNDSACDLQFLR